MMTLTVENVVAIGLMKHFIFILSSKSMVLHNSCDIMFIPQLNLAMNLSAN